VHHFTRHQVERYNQPRGRFKARSKHGNYNAWVDVHGDDYEFFVSVDPDHVPQANFCERLLGYFRDPDVAFVVGPQVYGNYDN
jgi:cellulose synthase/poly-beta-1,6-N-acetylglucosamine synthase-like glycosyltransferase